MKNIKLTLIASLAISHSIFSQETNLKPTLVQEYEPKNQSMAISLKEVLANGLRSNPNEKLRTYDREVLELNWKDTYNSYWFPNIDLTLQTGPNHKFDKLYTGRNENTSPTSNVAEGTLGIVIEDYSLFNWGKDYLQFLNKKTTYKRERQKLDESRRELKHDIIIKYFELSLMKKRSEIYKEKLQKASFIYKLGREKAKLKKISKKEYFQVRTEFLKSRFEYQKSQKEVDKIDEKFAYFVGDNVGTRYLLKEELNVREIDVPLKDFERLGLKNSPLILNSFVKMENAKRNYQYIKKDNLPLPKISVVLGTYTHSFSKNGKHTDYRTIDDSKNIEAIASINATWTIWGEGGFLNSRKLEIASKKKLKNERNFYFSKKEVLGMIREKFESILSIEKEIEINKMRSDTTRKSFNSSLDLYINSKIRYVDIQLALEEWTEARLDLETSRFLHLYNKIELAKIVGIEDFPGEDFENLGSLIK